MVVCPVGIQQLLPGLCRCPTEPATGEGVLILPFLVRAFVEAVEAGGRREEQYHFGCAADMQAAAIGYNLSVVGQRLYPQLVTHAAAGIVVFVNDRWPAGIIIAGINMRRGLALHHPLIRAGLLVSIMQETFCSN